MEGIDIPEKEKRKKICKFCGEVFYKSPRWANYRWENRKYCSKSCCFKDPEHLIKMKQIIRSEEVRRKISEARKGMKFSLKHRQNLSKSLKGRTAWNKGKKGLQKAWNKGKPNYWCKGEKNVNWKGGITKQNKIERAKFQHTIQKEVFRRDNYTCQMCGSKEYLQVDHIQPWSEYIEGRFDINNCRTLCAKCHYKVTFGREIPITFKGWGNVFRKETELQC